MSIPQGVGRLMDMMSTEEKEVGGQMGPLKAYYHCSSGTAAHPLSLALPPLLFRCLLCPFPPGNLQRGARAHDEPQSLGTGDWLDSGVGIGRLHSL